MLWPASLQIDCLDGFVLEEGRVRLRVFGRGCGLLRCESVWLFVWGSVDHQLHVRPNAELVFFGVLGVARRKVAPRLRLCIKRRRIAFKTPKLHVALAFANPGITLRDRGVKVIQHDSLGHWP